ncbi:MAG: GntR family transcriptional regulator, partial [Phycisphaerae bacterium]|nr:GntR family transcriptional regulator [Phycisphaerae bacterium]
ISPGSNDPIYVQIVDQIGRAIATGELTVGNKLPPIRQLAGELVINPNTVARAYGVLEQRGLVSTKTGAGTFVTDPALRDTDAGQLNVLAERMDNVISQGINLGLAPGQIAEMLQGRMKQFTRSQKKEKRGK